MKKSRIFKLFALVGILILALFFVAGDLGQAQSQVKSKPDKPGKPKPEPKPCNNNGICEWEEYDSKKSPDDQPCPDCLPKIYAPLLIDQDYLQIACVGQSGSGYPYSHGKVFQFKCTGQNYIDGDIVGVYEDAWRSESIGVFGRVVSIGDADNDGDKEIIAVANYRVGRVKGESIYDQKILIFETDSDGNPNWTSPYFGNPSSQGKIWDCIIADADNDGENEVTLIRGKHIEIYRINYNSGDGSYAFSHVWTGPEYPSDISVSIFGLDVGDADNDGLNEVILAMFEIGAPIIWKKEGETWSSKTAELIPPEYWNPDLSYFFLGIDVTKVRDADNDGLNEIIAGGNNNRLMIWKYNEASGNYETVFISEDLLGNTPGVGAGDIDGDGENEVVAATSSLSDNNFLYVFKYVGEGIGYLIVNSILCDGSSIGLSVKDLDQDGKAEIVSATKGITIYDLIGSDLFSGYLVKTYNCVFGSCLEID